jgi:hypothetical protein
MWQLYRAHTNGCDAGGMSAAADQLQQLWYGFLSFACSSVLARSPMRLCVLSHPQQHWLCLWRGSSVANNVNKSLVANQ